MKKKSHQIIYDLIAAINPLDQLEEQHIHFVLQWIESGAEIFRLEKPATPDTHLVCYFVLFDSETNQVLLTDHRKSGLWLPPGGHVEIDEHPITTVKREAWEELGIEAEFLMEPPFFLTVAKTVGAHQHTDVSLWYLLKGKSTEQYNYAVEEFNQIRWFRPEEIPYSLSDPHMGRLIDKLHKSLNLNSYESCAKEYAVNTELLYPHTSAQKFMKMLPQDAQVIDIGCGPGRDAKVFQERGLKVTGVDFSPKMIAMATSIVPQADFHVMDIEKLNFPDNTFDGAWASASFLHLPKKNLAKVFNTIHSFLKPNGILYLSIKKGMGETLAHDKRYGNQQKFWSFFKEQEIDTLLKEARFHVMEMECTNPTSIYETHPIIRVFCRKENV